MNRTSARGGRTTPGHVKKKRTAPPPTGPGSKVTSLPPEVKRHVISRSGDGDKISLFELNFNTTSAKELPPEVYKNEEIMTYATRLTAPNNRIKKLPRSISALQGLREVDLRNNSMSTLPSSFASLRSLTRLDVSDNNLKSLPPTLHKAASLVEISASGNRLRTVPAGLATAPNLVDLDLSNNIIRSVDDVVQILMLLLFSCLSWIWVGCLSRAVEL